MTEFRVIRCLEDDDLIIYKRMFSLKNCSDSKRYFEVRKIKDYRGQQDYTGNQWTNWPAVKKYWKKRQERKNK